MKTYRGIFERTDGAKLALDFTADNRVLAIDHASTVALHHDNLRLLKVVGTDGMEPRTPGEPFITLVAGK